MVNNVLNPVYLTLLSRSLYRAYPEYFEVVVVLEEFRDELRSLPVDSVVADVDLHQVFVNGEGVSYSQSSLVA